MPGRPWRTNLHPVGVNLPGADASNLAAAARHRAAHSGPRKLGWSSASIVMRCRGHQGCAGEPLFQAGFPKGRSPPGRDVERAEKRFRLPRSPRASGAAALTGRLPSDEGVQVTAARHHLGTGSRNHLNQAPRHVEESWIAVRSREHECRLADPAEDVAAEANSGQHVFELVGERVPRRGRSQGRGQLSGRGHDESSEGWLPLVGSQASDICQPDAPSRLDPAPVVIADGGRLEERDRADR